MTVCQGCGAPLPPDARKWCSERCRKAQYGGVCVDCGARTYGGNGSANAPLRCHPCFNRHTIKAGSRTDMVRARERRERLVEMWAAGMTSREIAAEFGWTRGHLNAEMGLMRQLGYDLPNRRSPEQCARIREGRWGKAA